MKKTAPSIQWCTHAVLYISSILILCEVCRALELHYPLYLQYPSVLPDVHSQPTAGALHVFLALQSNQSHWRVAGFVYHDTAAQEPKYCRIKAQRLAPGPWSNDAAKAPQVYVFATKNATTQPVVQYIGDPVTPDMPCLPAAFRSDWQRGQHNEGWLGIRGVDSGFAMDVPLTLSAPLQSYPAVTPPAFWTFIGQYFVPDPRLGALALAMHIRWHQQLGFNGALLCGHSAFLVDLAKQVYVKTAMQQGVLQVHPFDYLPLMKDYKAYDQPVIENYVLLSLWGANVRILSIDLDELFATPVPATISHLTTDSGCLGHWEEVSMYTLQRRNALMPAHKDVVWAGPSSESMGTISRALDVWLAANAASSNATQQATAILFATDDMLRLHTLLSENSGIQPKALLDPSSVQRFFVHRGESDHPSAIPEPSCAFVLHLPHLFRIRTVAQSEVFSACSDWMWPLGTQK